MLVKWQNTSIFWFCINSILQELFDIMFFELLFALQFLASIEREEEENINLKLLILKPCMEEKSK